MGERSSKTQIEQSIRELAMIDRIIGLEAEVARLNIEAGLNDVRVLHRSLEWRVGRIVLAPARLVRKFLRK